MVKAMRLVARAATGSRLYAEFMQLCPAVNAIATPRRILLAGWLLFVVYAFPGFMSYDSVIQLVQARHLEPIQDWHPPMMAMMWRLTDHIVAGPFPMLVIQSALFLIGLFVILSKTMSERAAAIVASCVLLAPPVLAPMAVIWKDSQMAGFLLAGIAALLSKRRGWRITGVAFLSMATALRYNAVAATLPVLALLIFRDIVPLWKRLALTTAVWIAITLAAFGANRLATDQQSHIFQSSLALSDIAGTLRYAKHQDNHEILVDYGDLPWKYTDLIPIRARTVYSPLNTWLDLTSPGSRQLFTLPLTPQQLRAVVPAWASIVTSNFRAYLHYRKDVFSALLDLREVGSGAIWQGFTDAAWSEDVITHRAKHSELQTWWLATVQKLDGTALFRPWIYLVLCIAFVVMARKDLVPLVVLASGLANELALFVLAPSTDYRYSHWMIVTTIAGGAMLFAIRRRRP
jgi:hypothetical protein